jgi:hypothetical protein
VMTPLTFTHLRFHARAVQNIRLGQYQGAERLRDALAQIMLRAVCADPSTSGLDTPRKTQGYSTLRSGQRAKKPTPEHAATCPACWLLAAETDPGAVRRVYSLAGPQPPMDTLAPNQDFHFTITLFGDGFNFLPYFVLAASAMGEAGIGPGRGKFEVRSIEAVNPLRGESHAILSEGEKVVRPQSRPIVWKDAEEAARAFPNEGDIRLRFLSPTRLIESDSLVKAPDFGIFFRRLLERMDELAKQHSGGGRRAPEAVNELYQLADEVRLIEQSTQWIDLWGPSSRKGQSTPMGGFVGHAVYRSKHWDRLLPFLLMGQGVQVGKLTAKGNGVFQVERREEREERVDGRGYWV